MATAFPDISCAICGAPAGRVHFVTPGDAVDGAASRAVQAVAELDVLQRPNEQAAVLVETFFGVISLPVSAERVELVGQAIADGDASALYSVGYSYAPFHCPECAASYCGAHWSWREFDDDPYSGIEGECPRGHFHLLAY